MKNVRVLAMDGSNKLNKNPVNASPCGFTPEDIEIWVAKNIKTFIAIAAKNKI